MWEVVFRRATLWNGWPATPHRWAVMTLYANLAFYLCVSLSFYFATFSHLLFGCAHSMRRIRSNFAHKHNRFVGGLFQSIYTYTCIFVYIVYVSHIDRIASRVHFSQIANNKITYGDHSDWITFIECSNKHHMCRISLFSTEVMYVACLLALSLCTMDFLLWLFRPHLTDTIAWHIAAQSDSAGFDLAQSGWISLTAQIICCARIPFNNGSPCLHSSPVNQQWLGCNNGDDDGYMHICL